jgi:hypothetical protein
MEEAVRAARTPAHLWIVGILATLWNAFGAYDYLKTRARDTAYLESMMPGVDANDFLAYIDAYPIWAQFGWGIGVWMGLLGSLLLLFRSRWAVHAFALSLFGMVLSFAYVFAGPPMPGEEAIGLMKYFPLVIVAVGIGLLLYALNLTKRGVLR